MHWCILLKESPEYEVAIELKTILRPFYKAGTDSNNGDFYSLKGASSRQQAKCSGSCMLKHAWEPSYGDAAVPKSYF